MSKTHSIAYLQKLHSDPLFKELIISEMEKLTPIVPPHDPSKDNTEIWKAKSAERRGFALACSILGVKI